MCNWWKKLNCVRAIVFLLICSPVYAQRGDISQPADVEAIGEIYFLRLDTTNDPLTDDLDISVAGAADNAAENINTYSTDGSKYSRLKLRHSRSNTLGTITETTTNDVLGKLSFQGVDTGPGFDHGAQIYAVQSAVSGAYVPSKLYFEAFNASGAWSNQLVLSDDGRIGVGTETPDTLFHTKQSNATNVIRTERTQAAITSSDILARWEVETTDITDAGIAASIAALSYGSSSETGWRFQAGVPSALIEVMQITPDGDVGLGTPWPDSPSGILELQTVGGPTQRFTRRDTSPTADDVIGRIEFENQDTDSSGIAAVIQAISEGSAGETGLAFETGATLAERMRIDDDGIVTIADSLQIGEDTVFSAFYKEEGDLYSDDGKAYFGGGINAVAERYGVGLQVRETALTKTLTYNVDATFTAATATIEKAGETFVSDGVVIDDFVILTDGEDAASDDYTGSCGEVLSLTETTIIVSLAAAGGDTPSDLTGVDFVVYNHPIAAILDNGDIHFNVGVSPDASLEVNIPESNNTESIVFDITPNVESNAGINIDYDANTLSVSTVQHINFDATAFDDAEDLGIGLDIAAINTGSTAGDFHAIEVSRANTEDTDLEVEALATRAEVDVVGQYLTDAASLDAAFSYDDSATTYTDTLTAFGTDGTNVSIFAEDNDEILLAAKDKFSLILAILNTPGSKTILPVFEYIEDDGDWVVFSPSDGTVGFSQNGDIVWDSDNLTTWGVRTVNEVTGEVGALDYYWIKVSRTRNILTPNTPIESIIDIETSGAKHYWDSDGDIYSNTISVTDGITAPSAIVGQAIIYVDVSTGNLMCKFGDGFTATLAVDQ